MSLSDIPTDIFNRIIEDLRAEGWETVSEYKGMDAWIDYGKVVLGKGTLRLVFEWDNWSEGSIEGPDDLLSELPSQVNGSH